MPKSQTVEIIRTVFDGLHGVDEKFRMADYCLVEVLLEVFGDI
jgi:hypothetical protein